MKVGINYASGFLFFFLLFCSNVFVSAQDNTDYITISGIVKDGKTKKILEFANVSVRGTDVGTVTNVDGNFTLKVNLSDEPQFLEVSYLGYSNYIMPLQNEDILGLTVMLKGDANVLSEVVVTYVNPKDIIKEAMEKIGDNFGTTPNLLTGFYREIVKKKDHYIEISEAVVNIYKTSYTESVDGDKVQVLKGRRLVDNSDGDTLLVKLQGGPVIAVFSDVVKNNGILLTNENLAEYNFTMEEPVTIAERPQYVISFKPKRKRPYAMFTGKFYIDQENHAFSRVDYSFDMASPKKVSRYLLKRKPFRVYFEPEEIKFLVTYRNVNGKTYLNYIRDEFHFKCDWEKRSLSTAYTVISETVVTGRRKGDMQKIPDKLVFKGNESFSDRVEDFYDENFWENYNIIESDAALEKALNKLKNE